jgi:hypothetical protein
MTFEFNEDAIRDLANRAVTIRAQEMQALLDEVRTTGQGKDVDDVKVSLATRWREAFDRDLTDPHLTAWAEQLAKGGQVIVKPELEGA